MATFRKRGDKWRVEVSRAGVRRSATFDTKRQAQLWASEAEAELLSGRSIGATRGDKTLADALERYLHEVAPTHKGYRREATTLNLWIKSHPLTGRRLDHIRGHEIADWRDIRLGVVSPGSVLREMTILRSVFECARRDWGWIAVNPMDDVRRPPNPRPRDRRPTLDEIQRLCDALGYDENVRIETKSQEVALAMLLSVETAMRAGELLSIKPHLIDWESRTLLLPMTKNGESRRVPLSSCAIELLRKLPGEFSVDSASLDALFRKAKLRCGITGLTFHDMRAEALTRLSKKVDVLTLARISGHKDIKMLMIYYRESAADIAARLD